VPGRRPAAAPISPPPPSPEAVGTRTRRLKTTEGIEFIEQATEKQVLGRISPQHLVRFLWITHSVAPRCFCPNPRNYGACRGPRLPTPTSHQRACRGPRLPTPTSHQRACRGPRLPTPTSHQRACRGPRLPTPTSHQRACRGPRLRRVFQQPSRDSALRCFRRPRLGIS
jgi:hypothetical protein